VEKSGLEEDSSSLAATRTSIGARVCSVLRKQDVVAGWTTKLKGLDRISRSHLPFRGTFFRHVGWGVAETVE
jgi:hypothetical protein